MHPDSVLAVTLDSCRFDSFDAARATALKAVGPLHRAEAPAYFIYASHQGHGHGLHAGRGDRAFGTAATGWFDLRTETGRMLTEDFEEFHFVNGSHGLEGPLAWRRGCSTASIGPHSSS